jgi:acetylornithine deacetylase/succinyl-diaminopimelate desuccinylase-like protein
VAYRGEDAPPSPFTAPPFAALAASVHAQLPGLPVVPAMSTGSTDGAVLRRAGVATYGILPFPLSEDDEGRMHAADERLPLDALAFGLRFVHDAALRIARGD